MGEETFNSLSRDHRGKTVAFMNLNQSTTLSTPSLGITKPVSEVLASPFSGLLFQLPLSGSRDHENHLVDVGLGREIDFQLPLSGSPTDKLTVAELLAAKRKPFNSLSRDHDATARSASQARSSSFNSLSRDHTYSRSEFM